jgi:endonuclease YncB( thermonuclease family)
MIRLVLACLLAALGLPAAATDFIGPARIVDGDTIEIGGRTLRLHGIDAPETGQSCERGGAAYDCAQEAGWALAERFEHHWATCRMTGLNGDLPTVICHLGGEHGINVNQHMVRRGWALADPETGREFAADEAEARAARAGLWAGSFVPPWVWRRDRTR